MSDLSDLSRDKLLAIREAARDAFAAAQAAAAKGIADRIADAVAILRECARAMHDVGLGDEDFDDALGTIRHVAAELAGDESEEDDADE